MTDIQSGKRIGVAEVYNQMYCGTLVQTAGVHQVAADTQQVFSVIVQNDPDSANPVYVGNALVQYFQLNAGTSLTIPIDRLTKVYVRFAGAATVNYIAMG